MDSDSSDIERERRMAPRARLETYATVHVANQELRCHTRDLSAEGLALIVDEDPVPSGTFMRVHLKLPDEKQVIDLDGILVRTHPESTGIVWGLRLLECEPPARSSIDRFVRTHAVRSSTAGDGFTSIGGSSSPVSGIQRHPTARPRHEDPD